MATDANNDLTPDQQIEALKKELAAQKVESDAKSKELAAQKAKADAKDKELANQKAAAETKEKELAAQKIKADAKDKELARVAAESEAKDAVIAGQADQLESAKIQGAGAQLVLSHEGKRYQVLAQKFSVDGVEVTAEQLKTNTALVKKLVDDKSGLLQEVAAK